MPFSTSHLYSNAWCFDKSDEDGVPASGAPAFDWALHGGNIDIVKSHIVHRHKYYIKYVISMLFKLILNCDVLFGDMLIFILMYYYVILIYLFIYLFIDTDEGVMPKLV